jgi:hypothetical protein
MWYAKFSVTGFAADAGLGFPQTTEQNGKSSTPTTTIARNLNKLVRFFLILTLLF